MTAQTIDFEGPVYESGMCWTVANGGTIVLAGRTFDVRIFRIEGQRETIHLTGTRGGEYLLRPYLGADDGHREIISTATGQPWRVRGNVVRALLLGDIIEERFVR